MVHCLSDFARLTPGTQYASDIWEKRAFETIHAFAERILATPQAYTHMLHGRLKLMALHLTSNDNLPLFQNLVPPDRASSAPALKTPSSAHYVKVSAEIDGGRIIPGRTFLMRVRIHVAENWHIQARAASAAVLAPTTVTLKGPDVDIHRVQYPEGKLFDSTLAEETLTVFEGETEILVHAFLRRSALPGEIEDMRLMVRLQACSDRLCLEPADIRLEMPMVVAAS